MKKILKKNQEQTKKKKLVYTCNIEGCDSFYDIEDKYTEEYITEFIKSHESVIRSLDSKITIILDWNEDRKDKDILNDFITAIKTKIQLSLTVE